MSIRESSAKGVMLVNSVQNEGGKDAIHLNTMLLVL
jgi:hypothetical protein